MAAIVGSVEQYVEGEDFEAYVERFQQFLEGNSITEEKRGRALFLTVCGPKVYQLLRNLCAPGKPGEKTLKELTSLAKEHYAPKVSVVVERYKFNSENQKENQTVSGYVAELKRKAAKCNFGTNLKEHLRDRFVCGVFSERIK